MARQLKGPKVDLSSKIIGHLHVIACLSHDGHEYRWICECDCGNITTRTTGNLNKGGNLSCGCANQLKLSWLRGSHGKTKHPSYRTWITARRRAKSFGVPFEIDIDDIIIPEFCPYLGIKLAPSGKKGPWPASPSLDKIIPELGYVKGNIQVISHKANGMKGAATFEEMELMVNNWRKQREGK